MKEQVTQIRRDVSQQLRRILEERTLTTHFQPIFGFREGTVIAHEALVRGPQGTLLQTPGQLFAAAHEEGRSLELNIVCMQEILRAFSASGLAGSLFLNASPQLILQRGFSQERAGRFLTELGIDPTRVVIELTEDYPSYDFRQVHESLMLYRAMGLKVAIDDLGEGFASLRLWSELKPEYVKADKHFVAGLAGDAVKVQFLRAIQHIAESCGSLVVAEGIENAEDFRVVKDIGIACGQGWFIGRPTPEPTGRLAPEAELAFVDTRVPVVATPRLRPGSEPRAHDFIRSVDALTSQAPLAAALDRFAADPTLDAIPVTGPGVIGVVSRAWFDLARTGGDAAALRVRSCGEVADTAPIKVEADLDLTALTAMLVETDARRIADGFVIVSHGRYLGMGSTARVMRALQESRVLASRYTHPLTLLPGQVPINEHLDRLLRGPGPFAAWFVELDRMRGLNDGLGFARGDVLIHETARVLEGACEPGVDFAGHVSGGRFVVLMQSENWEPRAARAIDRFGACVDALLPADVRERGYFTARSRDGRESVRPLPRLAIGIVPVLPGVFESRHEVVLAAKKAAERAMENAGSAVFVDQEHGNAYPQSVLFG